LWQNTAATGPLSVQSIFVCFIDPHLLFYVQPNYVLRCQKSRGLLGNKIDRKCDKFGITWTVLTLGTFKFERAAS
jgi:hypothetical protein